MRVFVDCGSFKGEALRKFALRGGDWVFHAFEPNRHVKKDYPKGTILHEEAVWTEDGVLDMYFSKRRKSRSVSSVMANKTTGQLDKEHPEGVPCIDFSKWLLHNFDGDDEIVLKMDIEGAEYPVLRKMLDDGSINQIDELYVELHVEKMDMDKKEHLALVQDLMSISSLDLHGDFLPSPKRPKSVNIEWYLK